MTTTGPYPSQLLNTIASVWLTSLQLAACPACKRQFLVQADGPGITCPRCVNNKLEPAHELLRPEGPELLVPFRFTSNNLRPTLEKFIKQVWLRPDDMETERMLERVVPLFWPIWLVDSDIRGNWQAENGYDYQVKSSKESYGSGGWRTSEVLETRIRWEPRCGQIQRHYDNVKVPALSDHQRLHGLVGAYQYEQAQPYQPDLLSGTLLWSPDVQPESAWAQAQARLDEAAARECLQAVGAEHVRGFNLQANYESRHWTQMLLPLYVTWYSDDQGQPHPIYLNGQSAVPGGMRFASQRNGWRLAGKLLAGAGVCLLITLLFALLGMLFPPSLVLSAILGIVALILAGAAIVPAAWPWWWNKGQVEKK
jgi:hypothetical protein